MRFPSSLCGLAFLLAGALAISHAQNAAPKPNPLTVIDPYLLTIPSNHELSVIAVVDAATGGKAAAKGIVADGTTAAVAVYKASSAKAVTFSVTNGARVAKYTPGFLAADPEAGASSLTVAPTRIGAAFYALALLSTGTAPDAEHGTSVTVTAQSAGSSVKSSYSMAAIPTPVVLIHGLWGNILALASTEGYLKATAAFSSYRFLVTPICYSVYLGFDAETDTLPGHGTKCEFTSAQSLAKYFSSTLYPQLDEDHYVGGRVDVVAHSMGGLAVRHFADATGYKSVRNRYLGAFRNVVTLDTPETGSALASYLDDVAYNRTLQVSNPFSAAYLLWTNFCGSGATTTVEECFDAHGLPLSYPGTALSTGAVYSLIPGGHSIASAPPADMFNTSHGRWFAVASDYMDGDQPPSLLRDVLNTVIAATYTTSPPTVDSILGSAKNDVVVTIASQTATALAAQSREFRDLQHTPAPGEAELLFGGDSNASVIDSAAVNGQVANWLGLQKTPAPAVAREPYLAEPAQAGAAETRSGINARFLAPQRLTLSAPDRAVGLGQPLRLALKLTGPDIVDIAVDQIGPGGSLRNESNGVPVGGGRATILSRRDGAATIAVTPLALGSVTLRVSVLFADGGLATRDLQLNVVPSAQGLASFDLNKGFKVLALVLDDREQDRQAYLFPEVQYRGMRDPVYLDDSSRLHLAVDQPEDDPVVQIDPGGLVHALRPGKAVITGIFDGVPDSIQVIVYSEEDAPPGYGHLED